MSLPRARLLKYSGDALLSGHGVVELSSCVFWDRGKRWISRLINAARPVDVLVYGVGLHQLKSTVGTASYLSLDANKMQGEPGYTNALRQTRFRLVVFVQRRPPSNLS